MKYIIYISLIIIITSCNNISNLYLPNIISDGMIIQQSSEVTFWGKALPGTLVKLNTDWDISLSSTTKPDSTWAISFATPKTDGQPHQINISTSDTTIIINNILLGEVWLASGQSNMEMPLSGWWLDTIPSGKESIKKANDIRLRMFNVQKQMSLCDNCEVYGSWHESTPEYASRFSAIAYYYGKMLRDSLNVPIGIINASWGGTDCESWISAEQLKEEPDFVNFINRTNDINKKQTEYYNWLNKKASVSINELFNDDFGLDYITAPESSFDNWKPIQLPGYWEDNGLNNFDGIVWFTKKVKIPKSWFGHNLTLELGAIDDFDMVIVNGVFIGQNTENNNYNYKRTYEIPAHVINGPELTIAIKVIDVGGYGGFRAQKDEMKLICTNNDFKNLSGEWLYCVAGEFYNNKIAKFDIVSNSFTLGNRPEEISSKEMATTTYNGMISPISKYTIAGLIWYQGESNVGRANQYQRLMNRLAKSMRNTFNNQQMPIITAQISPWHYNNERGIAAACLREAQRRAAIEIPNCYIISTLDLGSPYTTYSRNKKEIGQRMSKVALDKVYGIKQNNCPEIKETIESDPLLIVKFDNANNLRIDFTKNNYFEIAGEDGEFYVATVIINKNELTLFSHAVAHPKYVRYGYFNMAEASLFNEHNLPAPSFTTAPFFCE